MLLISIILLNYNRKNLTISCIESLYKNFETELKNGDFEIILVDNASEDQSVETIKSEVIDKNNRNIILIKNNKNSGFGKGCNIGAEKAKGKYLLFLNNDTVVHDRGILSMAQFLEKNTSISIIGGQLKNPDGTLQVSTGSFYNFFTITLLLSGMQRIGMVDKNPNKIQKVDWVKGGLFMIKQEVFEKLNGFDENIFMYTEDMELCYRAKKKGFNTYFYPNVNIEHKEYGSTNRTFAIVNISKNLVYFYKKHKSYPEYFYVKTPLKFKAVILIFTGKIIRSKYLVDTYKQVFAQI